MYSVATKERPVTGNIEDYVLKGLGGDGASPFYSVVP